MTQDSDLTFFTNKEGRNLLERFKALLKDTCLFDVLVGYFRTSGFHQLQDSIESVDKTRILVGIGVDQDAFTVMNQFREQTVFDFESHGRVKKQFQTNLINDIENATDDDRNLEIGLRKFIRFFTIDCPHPKEDKQNGGNGKKLEIRAYPSRNLHAKVYIGRFPEGDKDFGFVITGSSNFSYSGLVANREFNVELRKRVDVQFALEQFQQLWAESVDISIDFVDTVQKKTWLNDTITPYELYLKLIYEYLQEDINLQESFESFLPEGYMKLHYQEQAVLQALKKLEEFNGVFIADVVGMGKTFITAQILQQIRKNALVICPPVLQDYWRESLQEFRVPSRVESLGKLEQVLKEGVEKYDYIVVDEAHRFRNEHTQSYAHLMDICRGKKVILVTATPLNNKIDDILAQLKLFQAPRKSTIPGIRNLDAFFKRLGKIFIPLDKNSPEFRDAITQVSTEIREKVLKHVMVRRTRSDVLNYFKKDIQNQGLFFPEMQDPQKLVYQLEGQIEDVFKETIRLFKKFRYTRYIPFLYYNGTKRLTEFECQQQRNVGAFMKSLLVKRMESSFYAFKKSIARFVESYENFIHMFEKGTVYISKKVNVYDLLENDDYEKLERLIDENKAHKYASTDFDSQFLPDLQYDLEILKSLHRLWKTVNEDPKLDQLVYNLLRHPILKKQRLVVFTESKETGEFLYERLLFQFGAEVMFYCSDGGRYDVEGGWCNRDRASGIIKRNYDPNQADSCDDIRILISTDVLAEGINLHRANTLINYDLPWNPTRVLQRTGRINRLGTQHSTVNIFNFFPTSQADMHLGLEINITRKIQMFHDILGEDAKYLSDGEEIGSRELFDTLNNKNAYTGEDGEGDSELKYLEMMRDIRDNQPDLFEKIRTLPKKARSASTAVDEAVVGDQLITFFRLGKLKKFYANRGGVPNEITFFDAVNAMACPPDTPRLPIPVDYFNLLEGNKESFCRDTMEDGPGSGVGSGGRSNLDYIQRRLKTKTITMCRLFTDSDFHYIDAVREMINQGVIAKKTAQKIKKDIERTLDPLVVLNVLRKHIPSITLTQTQETGFGLKREVILSGYLKK